VADNKKTRAQGSRRRTLTDPSLSPHLAGLGLTELRAYRQQLMAEEDKVSYWRRLVHARLDVLEAEIRNSGTLTMEELIQVLGDTGTGKTRTALVAIRPADPLPELPVLAEMWITEIDPHDVDAIRDAMDRLRVAEVKLTWYRKALHQRIDEATGDLIGRYQQHPSLALSALPG
jgi:anti-sigma-K factor RsiG